MIRVLRILWISLQLLPVVYAQVPEDACRISNEEFIVKLDSRWTLQQQNAVLSTFDIQNLSLDSLWRFQTIGKLKNDGWNVRLINQKVVELVKPLNQAIGKIDKNPAVIEALYRGDRYRLNVAFGANKFRLPSVYTDGEYTTFTLRGFENANRVFLAGTFNDWSPQKTAMLEQGNEWKVKVKLSAGKHLYKFVVDGKWHIDPQNLVHEDDGLGNINSVYFVGNHKFYLKGFQDAGRVVVSGSFNDWDKNDLVMNRTAGGWQLSVYLREGVHAYKFLVDKKWILDPGNQLTRPDGKGNSNSIVAFGDTLFFRLPGYENANRVFVAGNFNKWNATELPLKKTKGGWELPYILPPGNYEYKFIVDGRWLTDPFNAARVGGEDQNSVLPVKANHTFRLKEFENARQVVVSGTFNDWNPEGYVMKRERNEWVVSVYLPPGKTLYKFIVDGRWILDPDNDLWEQNEHHTGNSVLWMGYQ